MTNVSLIGFIIILWGLATGSRSVLAPFVGRLSPPVSWAKAVALSLLPLYAGQLAIVVLESGLQSSSSPYAWLKTLPIPVYNLRYEMGPDRALLATCAFGLGILESAAVAIVILTVRNRLGALGKRFVVTLVCGLALMSLAAPAMSTADPYEYVAAGMLGLHAYAPAHEALAGTMYAPYQKLVPLKGVIYGPLWLLVDTLQTSLGRSIYEKIEALRITNVAFVGLFVWLLARAGFSRAATIGFSLNPCTWFYFVANPHADIEGLALLAAAFVCARRSNLLGSTLLVAAAGLIKFPFVVIGAAALVPLGGVGRRFGAWIIAIGLATLVSSIIPGPAYLNGLSQFAAHRAAVGWSAAWLSVAAAIAIATLLLVALRRGILGAGLLFQQLTILSTPWYLFWGVPYAFAAGRIESYLVALPLAAALLDATGTPAGAWQSVLFLVILALGTDTYASMRHRTLTAAA